MSIVCGLFKIYPFHRLGHFSVRIELLRSQSQTLGIIFIGPCPSELDTIPELSCRPVTFRIHICYRGNVRQGLATDWIPLPLVININSSVHLIITSDNDTLSEVINTGLNYLYFITFPPYIMRIYDTSTNYSIMLISCL